MIIFSYLSLSHEFIVYKRNAYFFFFIEQTTDREKCLLAPYLYTPSLLGH
jgi:hypothetical protein